MLQEETREILECRRREFDSISDSSTGSSLDSRLSTRPLAFLVKMGRGRRREGVGGERRKGDNRPKALVIDGGTLPFVLGPALKCLFLDVAKRCTSVICSRATPIQKVSIF